MRLRVVSDIHNDQWAYKLPQGVDCDLLIVAGDIGGRLSGQGRLWLEANLARDIPVIVVPGNHDYYGADPEREVGRFERRTNLDNVTVLDGTSTIVGGVRFVGGTLWTDYQIYGTELACQKKAMSMTDFSAIRLRGRKGFLRPHHLVSIHERHLDFIDRILATPFDGPSVVVTHHAPHPRSLMGGRATEEWDGSYASNLEPLILKHAPELWIHGHVHENRDYRVGQTRVVANPRGYLMSHGHGKARRTWPENPAFDPALVVEVTPRLGYDWATIEHTLDHPDVYGLPAHPPEQLVPRADFVRRYDELRRRFAEDPNVDDEAIDRYVAEHPHHFRDDEDDGEPKP